MSFIYIIRPLNIFFVFITTLFGAYYPEFNNFDKRVIFAGLSASLISAAGYVVNDYFDRYIDRINRPTRMIPSGKISPYTAYLYSMFLFIIGLAFSFFTQRFLCIVMAFLNTFFLFFYAKIFKNKFLIGNLIVSYAAASTFLYGAFVTKNVMNILSITIIAFFFTLIREFVKDAQDYQGDKKFGSKTIAVILGQKKTIFLSLIVSIVIIVSTIFLYYAKLINVKLMVLFTIINIFPVVIVLRDLYNSMNKRNFIITSNFLKLEMLLVLVIFYFGR